MKAFIVFKSFKEASFAVLSLIFLSVIVFLSSCSQKDSFLTSGETRLFVQDLNPPYLDILWVLDDRSPMYSVRHDMIEEAQKFFVRLDSIPDNYQMGITTMDMLRNQGALKPSATVLTKARGTLTERVNIFGSILSQVINLQTGAENTGFAATLASLNTHFTPRAGVPLVLVFISDGDDFSDFSTSTTQPDAVEYFASRLLSLKENKEDLVKVYSINYVPITGSMSFEENRCATRNNADIDKQGTSAVRPNGSPWFQDRYFRLAKRLKGDTANLCSDFADKINLSGLRLKTLPSRFKLETKVTNPSNIRVLVTDKDGRSLTIGWSFDLATNEVVFVQAPPEGSAIQIIIGSTN